MFRLHWISNSQCKGLSLIIQKILNSYLEGPLEERLFNQRKIKLFYVLFLNSFTNHKYRNSQGLYKLKNYKRWKKTLEHYSTYLVVETRNIRVP